jgi:ribonuclease HI
MWFFKELKEEQCLFEELWGVLEGLRMANSRGHTKVELHVDSKVIAYT